MLVNQLSKFRKNEIKVHTSHVKTLLDQPCGWQSGKIFNEEILSLLIREPESYKKAPAVNGSLLHLCYSQLIMVMVRELATVVSYRTESSDALACFQSLWLNEHYLDIIIFIAQWCYITLERR